jgi:hypothetical protein
MLKAYQRMPNGVGLFFLLFVIANISHVLLAYTNTKCPIS